MRIIYCILFSLIFSGLSFSQMSPQEYAEKFSSEAIRNMEEVGVPASITLAQGILESASGNSYLATKGNNHFGIKCHSSWTGKTIYADDDAENECFRKYNSVYESFRDHAEFLRNGRRYRFLFDYDITDYKSWARGLSQAGYATDPLYADKLISIIERYHLYTYDIGDKPIAKRKPQRKPDEQPALTVQDDKFVIQPPYIYKERYNNGVPFVYARQGDDIKSLAEALNVRPWQIRKYNNLERNHTFDEGDIVYLRMKRWRASHNHNTHTVSAGETLHDISQMYAVRIWRIQRLNNLPDDPDLTEGMTLKLR